MPFTQLPSDDEDLSDAELPQVSMMHVALSVTVCQWPFADEYLLMTACQCLYNVQCCVLKVSQRCDLTACGDRTSKKVLRKSNESLMCQDRL